MSKREPYLRRLVKWPIGKSLKEWGAYAAALLAIVGVVALAFSSGKWISAYFNTSEEQTFNHEDYFKVLLLPFGASYNCVESPVCEKAIQERFNKLLLEDPSLKVELRLDTSIDVSKISISYGDAEELGKARNADMIIWGDDASKCDWDSTLVQLKYTIVEDGSKGQTPYVEKSASLGYRSIGHILEIQQGRLIGDVEDIIYWILGYEKYENKQYADALGFFRRIRLTEKPGYAFMYAVIARTYYEMPDYSLAIEYYDRALSLMDTNDSSLQEPIATLLNNLGMAWASKGQYDRAIEYYKKSLSINLKVHGEQHPNVATGYNNLGSAWVSKGQYDRAIEYYGKSLNIDLEVLGEQHPSVATDYNNLGLAWGRKGQYDKAIGYYEKAMSIDLKVYGDQHPSVAIRYNNLGSAWYSKGQHDRAIEYYEKALNIDLKVYGDQHREVAIRYNNLGMAWCDKGQYDRAIGYYGKALRIFLKVHGEQPNVATSYNNLGSAWASKGHYDRAIEYYGKALNIDLEVHGEQHPDVAIKYNNLGTAWEGKEEYDRAIGYYEKALGIFRQFLEDAHPTIITVEGNLHAAQEAAKKK